MKQTKIGPFQVKSRQEGHDVLELTATKCPLSRKERQNNKLRIFTPNESLQFSFVIV